MNSRRMFLKTAALTGAGILLPNWRIPAQMMGGGGMGGGCGGGGGMSGGTTVIDPPPGALFHDPPVLPNLSTVPALVEVNLQAAVTAINVNGTWANLLTYNGAYPGPTIKVRSGDLLRVNLANSLSMLGTNILGHDRDITNLHTHGLHVSPMGNSDNVMIMLMSGERFTYEYDLGKQPSGSMNFYHPHVHGSVAEQYWGGMAGVLDVADDIAALSGFESHLVVLKDIELTGSSPQPYASNMDYMMGKEGNTVMVNGMVNPVLPIKPGQIQRWKILNASNARFYRLALEGHSLYVVGTDGGLLDKPYPVSSILLSPGERVDVLVKASTTPKNYRLLSLPYNRGCGSAGQQVTLLTLADQGSTVRSSIPSRVDSRAVRLNPSIAKTERLSLSMAMGRGYINGVSFEMLDDGSMNTFEIHSRLGTYEIWEITNQSMMDHPFHQHVNGCQVLSISGGDAAYASLYTKAPAWKDVVLVPKMGSVRILVPVMDYEGMSMFHCHIVEHEDIGMMGLWHIMDGSMQ